MFTQLLGTIAPVMIVIAVGYLWAKIKKPYDTRFVSDLVINAGSPCLIVASLVSVNLNTGALLQVFFACVLVMMAAGMIAGIGLRLTGQSVSTYLPAMVFPNIGNMGLPLCLYAFGAQGLALAVAYFTTVSIFMFTCGPLIAKGGLKDGLLNILKHPIIISVVVALGIKVSGVALPVWMMRPVQLIGDITIPLMLFTLGVSLSRLKVENLARSILFGSLRILLGLGTGLLVVAVLGITGTPRGVILIQASMPVAVFNYLFAVQYDRSPELVAGIVVFSTLISFCALPLILTLAAN